MNATPKPDRPSAPAPTSSLAARLAAELIAAAGPVSDRYATAMHAGANRPPNPLHPRPVFNAVGLVPTVVGGALDTSRALDELVTNPPENLATRARLTERLSAEAGTYLTMLGPLADALTTVFPPESIAEAIESACAEVARLEDHAATWASTTYDDGDEAGQFAAIMAAQVRGEVIGARRVLALLLGLETGEAPDGGEAEAYVAAWRTSKAAAAAAAERSALVAAVYKLYGMFGVPDGPDWGNLPLIMAGADVDPPNVDEGTEAHAEIHGTLVVPARFTTPRGVMANGNALPVPALDELVRRAFGDAEALYDFLETHAYDHEAGTWVADTPPAEQARGAEYTDAPAEGEAAQQ